MWCNQTRERDREKSAWYASRITRFVAFRSRSALIFRPEPKQTKNPLPEAINQTHLLPLSQADGCHLPTTTKLAHFCASVSPTLALYAMRPLTGRTAENRSWRASRLDLPAAKNPDFEIARIRIGSYCGWPVGATMRSRRLAPCRSLRVQAFGECSRVVFLTKTSHRRDSKIRPAGQ
jgi:hypothetical protein